MAGSVFESRAEKAKEKKLVVPIPAELEVMIDAVREELKAKAPGMRFNTAAICVDALTKAARKAKKELSQMRET